MATGVSVKEITPPARGVAPRRRGFGLSEKGPMIMPKPLDSRIPKALRRYVTDADLARQYDLYHEGLPLLSFDERFVAEEIADRERVLDVGCGTARSMACLGRLGCRCVGMDLSAPMLEAATQKLRGDGLPAALVRADMCAPLPFRDASFDAVVCMFSTMGLIPTSEARRALLAEVARVLAPGGVFVFHVHNRLYNVVAGWGGMWLLKTYTWNRLFTRLEVGDRIMRTYRGVPDMFLHVFTAGEVRRLARAAGLRERRVAFLNDDRDAEVTGRFASVRANGFIFSFEKPA